MKIQVDIDPPPPPYIITICLENFWLGGEEILKVHWLKFAILI